MVRTEIRNQADVLVVLVVIALIGTFYLLSMRTGHDWGDDFSHYILHAKNIAEGRNYSDTGYIHNPLYPALGPKNTYPVLPIILAPVYKLLGLNLTVLKIVVLLFFLGALFILFLSYRTLLPSHYSIGLVLLVGMNPYLWDFKDHIMSDFPFLFFMYASLYAMQRYYDNPYWNRSSFSFAYASLVGALIYLSYGTRGIGGLLLPSLLVYDVMRCKGLSRFAITVSVIAGSLIVSQAIALSISTEGSYVLWIQDTMRAGFFKMVSHSVVEYAAGLSAPWDNGYSKAVKYVIYFCMIVLAVVGYRKRLSDAVMVHEVFFIVYLSTLLFLPGSSRYLVPIIPLYLFYVIIGARELSLSKAWDTFQYVPIVLGIVVVLSYFAKFSKVDYGPITEGVARAESQELFQYIQERTQPRDVIVFRKPRALALFTGRRASIYPKPSDDLSSWDIVTWKYFQDIQARYLVVTVDRHALSPNEARDIQRVRQFVERYKDRCEEVFSNADFSVYEVKYLPKTTIYHTVENPIGQ